jgi:hypothetical protein
MGQCPSSTIPSTFSLDEEEFSVAATPNESMMCHAMLSSPAWRLRKGAICATRESDLDDDPSSSSSSSSNKNKRMNDIRKNFLKLHRPDIAQRCIIEPDEVNQVLAFQAEELLRRRGLVHWNKSPTQQEQEDISDKNEDVADMVSRFDVMSEFGGTSMISGMTTCSKSTIVAGNSSRTKHFGKSRGDETVTNRSTGRYSGASTSRTILNSVIEVEGDENLDPRKRASNAEKKLALTSSKLQEFPTTVADVPATLAGSEIAIRRSQYMSVLRLKIKAHLSFFYKKRYLLMFPDGPKPHGIQSPKMMFDFHDYLSDTSSESSSSSHNSGSINYGALPPAVTVKCSVTDDAFLDMAVTGSLGLVPRQKVISRSTQHARKVINNCNKLKSPDHYIVLINKRSGIPLAVCAMKAASGFPIVRIYATRQRVYSQRPAATTHQLGLDWAEDLPLFTWAEVVSDGDFPCEMNFSIFMASGSEGRFSKQPSYEATFDCSNSQPIIKVLGRTDMEHRLSGCALISIRNDDCSISSSSRQNDSAGLSFHIDLAQGIDPALLICFTAIADEVIEKSMRMQCTDQARRRIRKASDSLARKRMETNIYKASLAKSSKT